MNTACTWLAVGALLASFPAVAHEGDTFRPYVSAGYYRDSNLFRLAGGESPATPREDSYALYQAGIQIDWKPGRQQFLVDVSQTRIRYNRNTFLDFEGNDTRATWNWRLGNRLSGNIGFTQSSSQSNFDSVGLVNNSVDRERRFARAEWEFHPRWRIGGGVDTSENTNSAASQLSQNFTQDAYDLGVTYRTPKGSSLRALVRKTEADYPVQQTLRLRFVFPSVFFDVADNSFDQTEYLLAGDWRVSGKLNVRGQAGWVSREYRNTLKNPLGGFATLVERPDYSGFTLRGTADWFPTAKTLLSLTAYQELGGANDINASSVEKRGAKLDAVWLMREKWRLNAGLGTENRDFQGDSGVGGAVRSDSTSNLSLSLRYAPINAVSIDFGVQFGRRDSNFVNEEFDYRTVFANARADF